MWFNKYLNCDCDGLRNKVCGVSEEKSLTYGELSLKAKAVAYCLSDSGVKNGDIVGVMMDSGVNYLIAVHSIWLAGATFLFLDATLPSEILQYILNDTGVEVILTESNYLVDISLLGSSVNRNLKPIVCPIPMEKCFSKSELLTEDLSLDKNSVAYIIYTSGSTGVQKGVMCTHKGIENLCKVLPPKIDLNEHSVTLQFASLSFDASIRDIFCSLYTHGKLVLASKEEKLPGKKLADLIMRTKVTHICLSPSILGTLKEYSEVLTSLKTVVTAGEVCPPNLIKFWKRNGRKVFNEYGPTEGTVCATIHEVTMEDDPVPIGKQLPGITTYILNENREICPSGTKGELAIGGKAVAKGYINKPELSAQKFISLPLKNDFCFLTRDLVVEREGILYFLGRLDRQVKIRGLRIELEAIENIIYKHPDVKTCVVELFSSSGQDIKKQQLFAYISKIKNSNLLEKEMKKFISQYLPLYMVPSFILFLESFPMLQNNSKINRKALPIPDCITKAKSTTQTFVIGLENVKKDDLEMMCNIFCSVLKLPAGIIKENDDFFSLGGDSLTSGQILMLVEKFMNVSLPAWAIYHKSTPKDLFMFCSQQLYKLNDNFLSDETKFFAEFKANRYVDTIRTDDKIILFTGATGFLGSHLLSNILNDPKTSRVYCLIRSVDDEQALKRLQDTFSKYRVNSIKMEEKIIALSGDIAKELLGLSLQRYNELSECVTSIINSGANISYVQPYLESYIPNVLGVKNLLEFSVSRRLKSFHHISSVCIYGAEYALLGINEVDENYDIEQSSSILKFESGYVCSKWAAERILMKARSRYQLPVNIYRPGFISGHSVTGISNTSDLLSRLIIGCIQMKSFPDFPHLYWSVLPVDFVAEAISQIVLSKVMGENFNILPKRPKEPSHTKLFEIISSNWNSQLEKLNHETWLEKLNDLPENNSLFPLVRYLTQKVYYGKRTTLELHHKTAVVHCRNTQKVMQRVGVEFPNFNDSLLNRYLDYFASLHLI